MRFRIAFIFITFITNFITNCSKKDDTTSELMRVPSSEGTLYVQPGSDELITGGVVQYRIYKTGDVFYSGDISYFTQRDFIGEIQVPFSRRTRIDPATALTANYKVLGTLRREGKVQIQTTGLDANSKSVVTFVNVVDPVKVDSPDASGSIVLDASATYLTIVSAELEGTVFDGTPFKRKIKLVLSNKKN